MIPGKVRWKKRKSGSQEMSLNITSMADIFTIILVFLLKSFSTEGTSLTPGLSMQLPTVKHGVGAYEGLKVEISEDAIQVDGKIAALLKGFEFNPSELTQRELHAGVEQAMGEIRAKHPTTAKVVEPNAEGTPAAAQVTPEEPLTIMADYKTPYNTLKTVLASAANHGYLNYRLVVVKEEE